MARCLRISTSSTTRVDGVVAAVQGDGPDDIASLTEPVHPAFALFVSGGVPGQVVVHHRGERFLQVDSLAQAVGSDQNVVAIAVGQPGHSLSAFGRRELTGHGLHVNGTLGGA